MPAAFVERTSILRKTLTGARSCAALEALRDFTRPVGAKRSAASLERTFGAEGKERTLKCDALERRWSYLEFRG